jgi:ATP-binding protein involved in chromosome partitioning
MSENDSRLDFRNLMIKRRLRNVRRVLLVLSGKGGVGKSVVSAALSALMADLGFGVGLMDADLYGPSSALLFNTKDLPAEGEAGLIPPVSGGVKVMSVDLFASGKPVPLTGSGARQVILELLALTNWGKIDCLVVDMPPATGDIMLSFTSLGKKEVAAVVVTMPDRLSTAVAHRILQLLKSGRVRTIGVVGNMLHASSSGDDSERAGPKKLAKEFGVPLLGLLPFDSGVSNAVERSDIRSLLETKFARELRRSMQPYIDSLGESGSRFRNDGRRRSGRQTPRPQ